MKLSICIDMGAKNNGVYVSKTNGDEIVDKKAFLVKIEEKNINFSKKSRRENRHKDRNYKRRKLAKRLLREFVDFSKYSEAQHELIQGLLNNRGYTFISTLVEFDELELETINFINQHLKELKGLFTKEDFESKISSFDDLEEAKNFILDINTKITAQTKKKKAEFYKDYQSNFSTIKKDLQNIKDLFLSALKELETGSKPRERYLQEIKEQIQNDFDFIKEYSRDEFYNLVANISNLQLRVLRKYFNNKFDDKLNEEKLDQKIKKYFIAFHYKTDKENLRKNELFLQLDKHILEFFKTTNPTLTIPPYEDMNNQDTYKCNSMLIKPSLITDEIKEAVEYMLNSYEFECLKTDENGELELKEFQKTTITSGNKKEFQNFTHSKYLQRILDIDSKSIQKELHPRNVFKHKAKFEKGKVDSIEAFKAVFSPIIYEAIKPIATKYYEEEEKILSGIYEENNSIFTKCNSNTPYKNNIKHTLLKPIFAYDFSLDEAELLIQHIKTTKGLQTALKRVSDEAKKYQNSFYHAVEANWDDEKSIQDKELNLIVKNLNKNFLLLKSIFENNLNIKTSYFKTQEKVTKENLKRVLNIFKQTYEILFKNLGGFNKTCKHCTIENNIRSKEDGVIAKRLLSDVAKPIDGMLDMMLERISYEIIKNINASDIKDIQNLEILLEQNKFEFEESLSNIKSKMASGTKKFNKNDYKNALDVKICPYSGKEFEKGDYDHILPQSKGVYNSKANLIYCSSEGNQKIKGDKIYTLELIKENAPKHLKAVFATDNLQDIKATIKKDLQSIKVEEFTNFNNLTLNQQIALRYALFMKNTDEFKKAYELVKKDKIKTFSNGTQKRLTKLIYEKLAKKFPKEFKNIKISSKTIDAKLISATRNSLAKTNPSLNKQKIQNSHSHCIDAMMVFYLANSHVKPDFAFEEIYLSQSSIINVSKSKTFINSREQEQGSYKLFNDTIYSEHYKHITKENSTEENLLLLIKYEILYKNKKNKKIYIKNIEEIEENVIYKVDINKTSNTLYELFINHEEQELKKLEFLDELRYCTSRKEIENIFFDEKRTKLLAFDKIKGIPENSQNLYKAVHKKLSTQNLIFCVNDEGKTTLNYDILTNLLKNLFESKQQNNKKIRTRGKKRHKFTLPILGSPKFRIKRENTWQVLANKDIATKNFLINNTIKAIPFFTKNTIPLSVEDLLTCLHLPDNKNNIYKVKINTKDIKTYIKNLTYYMTEASRLCVEVEFIKSQFKDINFDLMKTFKCTDDEEFSKFVKKYIETNEYEFSKYINSMRNNTQKELKATASLVASNHQSITINYKANTNVFKKKIILKNIK